MEKLQWRLDLRVIVPLFTALVGIGVWVGTVETNLRNFEQFTYEVRGDFASIRNQFKSVQEDFEKWRDEIDTIRSDVDKLSDQVKDLRSDVDKVHEQNKEIRIRLGPAGAASQTSQ